MITEKEIAELRRAVNSAQSALDQAIGRRDALLVSLKEDYGVGSLEEGKAKLKEMKTSLAGQEEKLEAAVSAYRKKWKNAKPGD